MTTNKTLVKQLFIGNYVSCIYMSMCIYIYACIHIYMYVVWDAPLYGAIFNGYDKIVEVLRTAGADVNFVDKVSYHHSVL